MNMINVVIDACRDASKVPAAMIVCGFIQAAAGLAIVFFKSPSGIFAAHGKAMCYVYYSVLAGVITFGLIEAAGGVYVSGDVQRRRSIGLTIIVISFVPITIVAAMGGVVLMH